MSTEIMQVPACMLIAPLIGIDKEDPPSPQRRGQRKNRLLKSETYRIRVRYYSHRYTTCRSAWGGTRKASESKPVAGTGRGSAAEHRCLSLPEESRETVTCRPNPGT